MSNIVSAAKVRAYYRGTDSKGQSRLASLPEEFHYNVIEGARGSLAPEVRDHFKRATRSKAEYVVGVRDSATVRVGRQNVPVPEIRKALAEAGVEVGKRGTLSAKQIKAYQNL